MGEAALGLNRSGSRSETLAGEACCVVIAKEERRAIDPKVNILHFQDKWRFHIGCAPTLGVSGSGICNKGVGRRTDIARAHATVRMDGRYVQVTVRMCLDADVHDDAGLPVGEEDVEMRPDASQVLRDHVKYSMACNTTIQPVQRPSRTNLQSTSLFPVSSMPFHPPRTKKT